MSLTQRRYDIDWLRVLAIGLLLIYHVAVGFQPWGIMIGFITTEDPWESLWIPMSMINIWRIPLLFFVSGMGVFFAIQKRSWKQLIFERARRILLPFVFGMFLIVPIHILIWQRHYQFDVTYVVNPGHLWFLGNIFAYVVIFLPIFFYLKRNETGKWGKVIKGIASHPAGWLLIISAFVAEALIINPRPFELYSMTWHGFFLGGLAFFFGFCFAFSGDAFRETVLKWRWVLLTVAFTLFILRVFHFQPLTPNYLLAIESNCWILSLLGWGMKYLNRPGKTLGYLSQAAYPVYIVHMVFLYLGSSLIFPLDIGAPLQFFLILSFTFAGCLGAYELIRKVNFLKPLFGLKVRLKKNKPSAIPQ